MASRLSSLLVRDGLVGVKRMEKAFQRQVIYGGSLDTILLEMGLVPDERLSQYLSLASGLPPAARAETNVFDAEAVRRCSEDVAHKYRVVPLALEGDALRVLVHEPVDMRALEELADEIDLPIQPLIVPEYRWHVVYARAYGSQAPARFMTLAKTIDAAPPTAPVGRAKSVVVEEPVSSESGADHVVVDVKDLPTAPTMPSVSPAAVAASVEAPGRVGHPRTRTMELNADAYRAELDKAEEQRREAEERRRLAPGENRGVVLDAPQTIRVETSPIAVVEPRAVETSGWSAPVPRTMAPEVTPGDAVIRSPIATGDTPDTDRTTPMSVVVAREALQVAEDRDRIFMLLLRALRSRARYAGLLTVQGGAVIGRVAICEPYIPAEGIETVLIPLDVRGAFRSAVMTQRPSVGPVFTGDPDVDKMLERMGGAVPPSALLMPIVLRDRVVALTYAHRVDAPLGLADVAELLPLAGVAADALGRLIVRHKAAGYRAPSQSDANVVEVASEDIQTKRHEIAKPASAWRIPTAQPMVPIDLGVARAATPPPMRPVADLIAALEDAHPDDIEPLFSEAVERAAEVVPVLGQRFPGKLRVDRYQVSGRPLRAAQYGALLELAVRIGPPVTDVLIEKMSDPQRDIRFYATVCAIELRPRSAAYALVERLFDADYGVRACAIEALSGYPLRDLDSALARARHALHSDDPERVLAAATAVAELGDVHSLPDLLDAIGRDGRRAEHARRALSALTRQDFGTSERKWRRWWDEHKTRHRIEWLIESLGHKETALRQGAADDLRRLTGEHFGYHHDLPRKDRDQAQQRWRTWWTETGRRRFARDEDERQRPTAMLPSLRGRE
jgi:hypothetical protein